MRFWIRSFAASFCMVSFSRCKTANRELAQNTTIPLGLTPCSPSDHRFRQLLAACLRSALRFASANSGRPMLQRALILVGSAERRIADIGIPPAEFFGRLFIGARRVSRDVHVRFFGTPFGGLLLASTCCDPSAFNHLEISIATGVRTRGNYPHD